MGPLCERERESACGQMATRAFIVLVVASVLLGVLAIPQEDLNEVVPEGVSWSSFEDITTDTDRAEMTLMQELAQPVGAPTPSPTMRASKNAAGFKAKKGGPTKRKGNVASKK